MPEHENQEAHTNETGQDATPDESLEEGGMRALKAERAANKELRRKLAAYEQTSSGYKTELEQLQESVKELKASYQEAELRATRATVAGKYGISAADAELLLTGTTEEVLTRQAEALAERQSARAPRPDLSQGRGSDESASPDKALVKQLFGGAKIR